ncbi:cullin-1-like [Cotesia typhae]|uniref:cullin-1-like n=1 Tax=Cotesia typhae TaxID=2053667 RepID=UPI003D6857D4
MESELFSQPASEGLFSQNPIEMAASRIGEIIHLVTDRIYSENPMDERAFLIIEDQVNECFDIMIELQKAGNFIPEIILHIFSTINERLKSYLDNYVTHLFESFEELAGEDFDSSYNVVSSYNSKWRAYKKKSRDLCSAFAKMNDMLKDQFLHPLDPQMALHFQNMSFFNFLRLSFQSWRDGLIVGDNNLMIISAVLRVIEAERDGEQIDTCLLSEVVYSYLELGELDRYNSPDGSALSFYEEAFEKYFLEDTMYYYRREVNYLSMDGCEIDYWTRTQQRLVQERDRAKLYLHESTENKLITVCENELTPKYLEDLMSTFKL